MPSHQLTKKDTTFLWGTNEERSFGDLKETLTMSPVLQIAVPSKKHIVAIDASNFAVGAVLMQEDAQETYSIAF